MLVMTPRQLPWTLNMTGEKRRCVCTYHLFVQCQHFYLCIVSTYVYIHIQLSQYDPVRAIALHQHLVSKLEQSVSVHGSAVYFDLINKVDVAVREQLLEFVPLQAAGQLLNIFLQGDIGTSPSCTLQSP